MRIFTKQKADTAQEIAYSLANAEGDAYLQSAMPPLFTMPEKTVRELIMLTGNDDLLMQWKNSLATFKKCIKKQHLTLVLLDPEYALLSPDMLHPSAGKLSSDSNLSYTRKQYAMHIEHLKRMEKHYENLNICFVKESLDNTLLYVKESTGVIMAKSSTPQTAFFISERNMVSAFWDYLEKCIMI